VSDTEVGWKATCWVGRHGVRVDSRNGIMIPMSSQLSDNMSHRNRPHTAPRDFGCWVKGTLLGREAWHARG